MPSVRWYSEGLHIISCLAWEGLVHLTARTIGNVVSTVLVYIVPVEVFFLHMGDHHMERHGNGRR